MPKPLQMARNNEANQIRIVQADHVTLIKNVYDAAEEKAVEEAREKVAELLADKPWVAKKWAQMEVGEEYSLVPNAQTMADR